MFLLWFPVLTLYFKNQVFLLSFTRTRFLPFPALVNLFLFPQAGKASVAAQMLQAAHEAHSSLTSAAPELQAAGVAEDAANLGARALVLLCWAHLDAGTSCDSALRCVQALQDHSITRVAASVAAPLLAHRALLQAGRAGEAETELLKVVTHEHSTREICAYAIKAALQAPGGAASARMALNAAQELTSSGTLFFVSFFF